MSLFDAIKYPISLPPKLVEITSLPVDIFRKWVDHPNCSWARAEAGSRYNPSRVGLWVSNHWLSDNPSIQSDILLLKRIIKEYEPL